MLSLLHWDFGDELAGGGRDGLGEREDAVLGGDALRLRNGAVESENLLDLAVSDCS
jgi:hypothetical protein